MPSKNERIGKNETIATKSILQSKNAWKNQGKIGNYCRNKEKNEFSQKSMKIDQKQK